VSLPTEFWQQLPRKTDEELYDMLAHAGDYLPEALQALEEELKRRNLPTARTSQLQARVESQKVAERDRADETLGWPMRILVFLLCGGLVGAVLAAYYDSKGYKRKSYECWITVGVAVLFHLVAGGLLFLMGR
jgi:hypothetical protein